MDGSKQAVAWDSESPNGIWIGRRDGPNELMLKDPSLAHPDARGLMSFPGGHNEGFPDTSKQMFREIYARIAGGTAGGAAAGAPSFPTFADGLREMVLCERILQSKDTRSWVRV
jgi:predicted dehydrogenase